MKKIKYLFVGFSLILLASCGNGKSGITKYSEELYLHQVDSIEKILYANPNAPMNKLAANSAVNLYSNFVKDYPQTKNAADYLFKAAEISSSLNHSKQAIDFFNTVYEKYPAYPKLSYCLFLQGFIYDNQLHDFKNAEKIYKQVIEKFPNEKIAEDAKASIANLGKSDEELIKEFEAKNKKSS